MASQPAAADSLEAEGSKGQTNPPSAGDSYTKNYPSTSHEENEVGPGGVGGSGLRAGRPAHAAATTGCGEPPGAARLLSAWRVLSAG